MRNSIAGNQTDLVLLDFSKAFDKVSHQKLLLKRCCAVRGLYKTTGKQAETKIDVYVQKS